MSQKLEPQFYKDLSSGMVTNINSNIIPANSVALGMNVDFDEEIGSAVSRLGSAIIGAVLEATKTILGLHYDAVNNKLFATVNDSSDTNSDIYDVVAGTKSLQDDTQGLKTRFMTFLGSTLRVNGTDAPKAYNGSWITSAGDFDLSNMPTGYSIAIEFLDRVYLMGSTSNPDKIVYSSTPSGSPLTVSWTVDNGFVNLEPEEGAGGITGAGKVPGYLLIFKRRSMKRWNFVSASPESMVGIGTPSHESVVHAAGICGFFSDSDPDAIGFYITDGTYPVPISHLRSKQLKKWIDAIDPAFYTNISGRSTETHMLWSIGDVTVDGRSYTNVVLRWSIKTGEWAVRSYPKEFRVFSNYVLSNVSSVVAGTTTGEVVQIDKKSTYDDYPNNKPIQWEVLFQWENWDFNQIKDISDRIIVIGENFQNAEAYILAGTKNGCKEVERGPLQHDISEVKIKTKVSGNYFGFGIRGSAKGARAVLQEVEVPNISVTDNYS